MMKWIMYNAPTPGTPFPPMCGAGAGWPVTADWGLGPGHLSLEAET